MGGGPHKAALFSIDAHIIDMNHVIKKKKKEGREGSYGIGYLLERWACSSGQDLGM